MDDVQVKRAIQSAGERMGHAKVKDEQFRVIEDVVRGRDTFNQKEMCTTNEVTKIANLNQQDPFVALLSTSSNTSMLRTSLNRGIASKALESPSHRFPIKVSDDSSYLSLEQKKKAKQRIRDLQTREQDLLRLQSKVQCIWDRFREKDVMHVFQDFKSF
ncbi:hypothetical protein EMCRGX_G008496 [Ephydatia muelleri]